jgi:hypothetical protein
MDLVLAGIVDVGITLYFMSSSSTNSKKSTREVEMIGTVQIVEIYCLAYFHRFRLFAEFPSA